MSTATMIGLGIAWMLSVGALLAAIDKVWRAILNHAMLSCKVQEELIKVLKQIEMDLRGRMQ